MPDIKEKVMIDGGLLLAIFFAGIAAFIAGYFAGIKDEKRWWEKEVMARNQGFINKDDHKFYWNT